MAARADVVKLLQEIRGFAELTYRKPLPPLSWKQSHAVLPPPAVLRRILFIAGDPGDQVPKAVSVQVTAKPAKLAKAPAEVRASERASK